MQEFKFAYQCQVSGMRPQQAAQETLEWMSVNMQSAATAYNPVTNEIRVVLLVLATSEEGAVLEASRQLALLKEDIGVDDIEIGPVGDGWPEWGDQMLAPMIEHRTQR